jgi:pSer/pThr/pTyr-binding forkhead associated (FHA) protein
VSDVVYVKYCPLCGAENPRQQPFCLSCQDGDLTTVAVEPRREQPPSAEAAPAPDAPEPAVETAAAPAMPTVVLEVIDDPTIRFAVAEGQTIGRTETADIVLRGVPKLDWISGTHAKFLRRGEQWYVQHIAETNFIRVDGELYRGHQEVAIYDGTILVLSLTAFRVKLT